MTDCPNGLMRDLLPEYAVGVLGEEDAARVAAHVAECDACRSELALLAQARSGFALAAPRVDVAAIVSALPVPPRADRAVLRPWMRRHAWQYASAAGLLLAVGGGIVWQRGTHPGPTPVADTTLARGAASAETTATSAAVSREQSGITFGGGLSDLSLEDLQALMGQVDSVRTLPSKDPESVRLVIATTEGGKTL